MINNRVHYNIQVSISLSEEMDKHSYEKLSRGNHSPYLQHEKMPLPCKV